MKLIPFEWLNAIGGGLIIGIAVSLMLFWNGRVTGVSGIISGLFTKNKKEWAWRLMFIAGLIAGGAVLKGFHSTSENITMPVFKNAQTEIPWSTIAAGLLVGIGTVLANGCTSGHGVCGVSRLSPRSIIATISFMLAGVLAVYLLRHFGAPL